MTRPPTAPPPDQVKPQPPPAPPAPTARIIMHSADVLRMRDNGTPVLWPSTEDGSPKTLCGIPIVEREIGVPLGSALLEDASGRQEVCRLGDVLLNLVAGPPTAPNHTRRVNSAPPPPRASADWFLEAGKLREIMADPRDLARRILRILPREAQAALLAYDEFGLSGSVTFNFNAGAVGSCETGSHHRLSKAG